MSKADPGSVPVPVIAGVKAATAAGKWPESVARAGYASRILQSEPLSCASAIVVAILAFQTPQSSGHADVPSTLKQFAPVAGATVALVAFLGTTLQYLRDRRRERGLRAEEGIAESTNSLTAFPGSSDAGIGSVVAALRNLRNS
jgi:hypothetical protein